MSVVAGLKRLFLGIVSCSLMLSAAGCPTPYHKSEEGLFINRLGYSEMQVAEQAYLVKFEGQKGLYLPDIPLPGFQAFPFPRFQTLEGNLFRRCAELAIEKGFEQFELLSLHSRDDLETEWRDHLKKDDIPYGVAVLIRMVRPEGEKPTGHVFKAKTLLAFLAEQS